MPYAFVVVITAFLSFLAYNNKEKIKQSVKKLIWEKSWSDAAAIFSSQSVIVLSVLLVIAALFSPKYYEYPGIIGNSTVITYEDGQINKHPWGMFIWEGGDYANMPNRISTQEDQSYFHEVTIHTENPKVRTILYGYKAEINDPDKYFRDQDRRQHSSATIRKNMRKLIIFQMYEFNEVKSKQLTKFYNPKDSIQQNDFNILLEDWVNSRLEKDGLKIIGRGFDIKTS